MKYVVIVTETCLEGGIVSRKAWLAETETDMKAMVAACENKLPNMGTQVMPVTEPSLFFKHMIVKCMPNNGVER
jgi:hypothetical protein